MPGMGAPEVISSTNAAKETGYGGVSGLDSWGSVPVLDSGSTEEIVEASEASDEEVELTTCHA